MKRENLRMKSELFLGSPPSAYIQPSTQYIKNTNSFILILNFLIFWNFIFGIDSSSFSIYFIPISFQRDKSRRYLFPIIYFERRFIPRLLIFNLRIILFLNGRLPILHCLAQPYFFVKFRCFPDVLSFFIKRYINRTPDISRILFL